MPALRRKKGDWVAIAQGRGNVRREAHVSIGCPFNAGHRSGSLSGFYAHLNSCRG